MIEDAEIVVDAASVELSVEIVPDAVLGQLVTAEARSVAEGCRAAVTETYRSLFMLALRSDLEGEWRKNLRGRGV